MNKVGQGIKEFTRNVIRKAFNVHRQGDKPNIIILSTPRSGSTWLMEMIAAEKRIKPCNEPFNLRKKLVAENLGISSWDTLAQEESLPLIESYVESFTRGDLTFKNPRPFQKGYAVFSNRLVFKVLFALENNLSWVRETLGAQIVVLVRHPIPVAISRTVFPRLESLMNTTDLCKTQKDQAQRICREGTHNERGLLDWCLQNHPIIQRRECADLFITYEQLVTEPDIAVDHLVHKLYLNDKLRIRKSVNEVSGSVAKSSTQSKQILSSRHNNSDKLLTKWQCTVDPEEEESLMEILKIFDLDIYESGSYLPTKAYWLGNL